MIKPDPIIDLSIAYWKSRAFLAAVHLGVFRHCGTEGLPFDFLAEQVGIEPIKLKPLIGALVELGLLEINSLTGDVCSTSLSHMYLNPHSPACMETSLDYAREMYSSWDNLEERLLAPLSENPTPSKKDTPSFLAGMHNRTRMLSGAVMPILEIDQNQHVLDVAAGAGTWSYLLQSQKGIQELTLVEQPELCAEMQTFIENEGLEEATYIASDYHDAFSDLQYDHVLFFGALHQERHDHLELCLNHLWERVAPNGKLWILDIFVVNNDATLFAHLFGLNMLLSSEGSVFELDQVEKMVERLPNKDGVKTHPISGSLPYYLLEIKKS